MEATGESGTSNRWNKGDRLTQHNRELRARFDETTIEKNRALAQHQWYESLGIRMRGAGTRLQSDSAGSVETARQQRNRSDESPETSLQRDNTELVDKIRATEADTTTLRSRLVWLQEMVDNDEIKFGLASRNG